MNRNELTKTLSYTFIELYPHNKAVMHYDDFMVDENSFREIAIKKEIADCIKLTGSEKCFQKIDI